MSKGPVRKRVPADVLRIARSKAIAFSRPKSHAGCERIIVSAKIAAFKAHLKHNDPRRGTKADAMGWKDALQAEGLSATTINGIGSP